MSIDDRKRPRKIEDQDQVVFNAKEISDRVVAEMKKVDEPTKQTIINAAKKITTEIDSLVNNSKKSFATAYNFNFNSPINYPLAKASKQYGQSINMGAGADRSFSMLNNKPSKDTDQNEIEEDMLSQLLKISHYTQATPIVLDNSLKSLKASSDLNLKSVKSAIEGTNRRITPMSNAMKNTELLTAITADTLKSTGATLSNTLSVLADWFRFDRETARQKEIDAVRSGRTQNGGITRRIYQSVVPPGSKRDAWVSSASRNIEAIQSYGYALANSLGWLGKRMVSALSFFGPMKKLFESPLFVKLGGLFKVADPFSGGKSGALSGITRLIAFLWRFKWFVGGVVGLLGGAMLVSLFKTPGMLAKYMGAFSDLFTKSILPAFQWLGEKFGNWWNSSGESIFQKIGDVLNYTLIYLIGTALPAVLNTIGRGVVNIVDLFGGVATWLTAQVTNIKNLMMNQLNSFLGIFGFGPNADKGILANLLDFFGLNFIKFVKDFISANIDLIGSIAIFILNSINNLLTGVLDLLGLSAMFNIADGDTVWGAFKGWLVGIADSIYGYFDSLTASITGYISTMLTSAISYITGEDGSLDPITMIKNKINAMIEAILGIFPSFEDIKRYMMDIVKMHPAGMAGAWLYDKIAGSDSPQTSNKGQFGPLIGAMGNSPQKTNDSILGNAGRVAGDIYHDLPSKSELGKMAEDAGRNGARVADEIYRNAPTKDEISDGIGKAVDELYNNAPSKREIGKMLQGTGQILDKQFEKFLDSMSNIKMPSIIIQNNSNAPTTTYNSGGGNQQRTRGRPQTAITPSGWENRTIGGRT